MQRDSIRARAVVGLLCVWILGGFGGCSKKQVSASSDDGSANVNVKESREAGTVETVVPEQMVTVPEDAAATPEISRESRPSSFDSDGESRETPSSPSSSSVSSQVGGAGIMGGPTSADQIGLGDVFFDFDQYVIRADAVPTMEVNAVWLRENPERSVVIEGHCDERGTMAYNLVLGEKRARAAKRYLEDLGIPPRGLKTTSYGEVRPFCMERDEGCYQLNRRAHFVVQ